MADDKKRKRMVVEEVGSDSPAPHEVKEVVKDTPQVEEPENKVNEVVQEEDATLDKPKETIEPVTETAPVVIDDTRPEIKSGSGPSPLVIIIPGIFLLGALLGGIVFYQKGISNIGATPTPTSPDYSNTATTPTPAATTPSVLDLIKYPINVMNGSGTPGQAGVVKGLLTSAGFKVSSAGNAPTYDFTKTIIKAKAEVPVEFLTKLSTTLSKDYVVDATQTLTSSSPDLVQVIVGSTKAK